MPRKNPRRHRESIPGLSDLLCSALTITLAQAPKLLSTFNIPLLLPTSSYLLRTLSFNSINIYTILHQSKSVQCISQYIRYNFLGRLKDHFLSVTAQPVHCYFTSSSESALFQHSIKHNSLFPVYFVVLLSSLFPKEKTAGCVHRHGPRFDELTGAG